MDFSYHLHMQTARARRQKTSIAGLQSSTTSVKSVLYPSRTTFLAVSRGAGDSAYIQRRGHSTPDSFAHRLSVNWPQ
jgi:hypothetical protein